jgi:hypothetical protein
MATQTVESIRQALNRVDPNVSADLLRQINFGDVLRGLPVYLRAVAPAATGATPQQLSTLGCLVLPEDAKAAVILRCTVKSSSVANGEFTIVSYGTTPATTQVAVAPNGDIVFLGSDAVTSADIIYVPQKGDVLGQLSNSNLGVTSLSLSVSTATGAATIPAPYAGKAILLMQANVTAGSVTGQKIILVPTTTVTATTRAALSQDATKIWFNLATDAPTACTVDLLVASGLANNNGNEINSQLEAANGGSSAGSPGFT